MTLSEQELADYRKAGAVIATSLAYGKSLVVPGANILDVCRKVEDKIRELGAQIAFPAQPSIDSTAAHWCPDPGSEETFKENQLVKLDIGCHVNGHVADTSISIDLSKDGRHSKLIKAAEDARDAALSIMRPGTTLGEIGRVIQDTITKAGFSPIRNLSGHGLGQYEVHTWPSVPNIDTGDPTPLEEGMVVAVEPFATPGNGMILEQDEGNIFSQTGKARVRGTFARQALKHIEPLKGLPFSLRWLADEIGAGQAKFALRELLQAGAVKAYPPLTEISGGIVSQAEHSVIITADGCIVYTRPE